jgi:GNAT superfamily N-acetyltransferase
VLFADVALARRIEQAEARGGVESVTAFQVLDPAGPAALEMVGGGCAAFLGAGSPLTHAIGLGMSGPVEERDFERLEDFYRRRGSPAVVDVCPLADPSFADLVSSRGYRPVEYNNVLARPIAANELAPDPPPGWEFRLAKVEEAEIWAGTLIRGFFSRDQVHRGELEVGATMFRMSSASPWMALRNEEPAACGVLMVHGMVAVLAGDSTLPSFRGRGTHAALIRARLAQAAARGCDLATASTLPGSVSQRNYERCGFQVVYTRIIMAREW